MSDYCTTAGDARWPSDPNEVLAAARETVESCRKRPDEVFVMSTAMLEKVKEQLMVLTDSPSSRLNGIPVATYRSRAEKAELLLRLAQEGKRVLLVEEDAALRGEGG